MVFVALNVSSDQPLGEGIAAALSNGFVIFFVMAGLGYLDAADRSVAAVAIAAAIGTLATLLTIRLVAVVFGARGPFGSVSDTVLDVAARSIIVLIVVAATGHWSTRSRSNTLGD